MSPTSLLQTALRRPAAQLLPAVRAQTTSAASRFFSHLPTLRPTLSSPATIFRPPTSTTGCGTTQLFAPAASSTSSSETVLADVVPKTAITGHPALSAVASQIRCGPRPTLSGATRLIQKRRHGFLSRNKTVKGRKIIQRRRQKGRKRLGHG
ncbi:hypothetical protein VTJ04DRAFT_6288 [Mycothermus thermophilus]|uniref:mitochondrial 54S ribosomal protein bL34m n=1 Tax=Humicola insolens TaxID=85995 RepID=UPI003743AE82